MALGDLTSLVDLIAGLQDLGYTDLERKLGLARQVGTLGGFAQGLSGQSGPLVGRSNRKTTYFGKPGLNFNLDTSGVNTPLFGTLGGGGGFGGAFGGGLGGSLQQLIQAILGQSLSQIGREERKARAEEQRYFAPGANL